MKQEKDVLHKLIKSLSSEESKGFETSLVTYQLRDRKNHSLLLFRLLSSMDEYDYATLIHLLKGKISSTTVSSVKSQLKKRLITYLRESSDTEVKRWHEMLEEADILLKKSVYSEAYKVLIKVRDEAKKANRSYYAIAALMIAGNVIQKLNEKELVSATFSLGEELTELAEETLVTMKIYKYYASNLAINFKNSMIRDDESIKLLKKLDEFSLDPGNTVLSPYQEYFYLTAKYTNARLKGNFEDMYIYACEHMFFLNREYDYLNTYQPHTVPIIYLNMIECAMMTNRKKQWEEAMKGYASYVEHKFSYIPLYHNLIDYHFYTYPIKNATDFGELHDAVTSLEKSYDSIDASILMVKKIYEMSLAGGYYKLRNYEKALDFCRKLMHEDHNEELGDGVDEVALMMALIIEFDRVSSLDNAADEMLSFQAFVSTGYHHFRKKKTGDYRLEIGLIDIMRTFAKNGNYPDIEGPLHTFKLNVIEWLQNGVSYVKMFHMSFDLLAWVERHESRLNRIAKSRTLKN